MEYIKIKNLSKKYVNNVVLNNISFEISKGQIFGIIGKNGEGKSTILKILTGIVVNYNGNIFINGSDIRKKMDKNLLGVFPDVTNFYNELNAIENLKYFSKLQGKEKTEIEIKQIFKKVDLHEYENKKVSTFSTGMKKKIGIAQAIINESEIIVLDEPTSGVDIISTKIINSEILKLKKDGKTIIITSHSIDQVVELCDVIGILENGKLNIINKDQLNKYTSKCYIKLENGVDDILAENIKKKYDVLINDNQIILNNVEQKLLLLKYLLKFKCNIIEMKDEVNLL